MIDFVTHFRAGLDHFNAGEFWDAHESWETIWLEAESDVHVFLQGLIQLAAAYHHVKRGTYPGGLRLFDAALQKLEGFPKRWCGIDRTSVEAGCAAVIGSGLRAFWHVMRKRSDLMPTIFRGSIRMIRRFRHLNTGDAASDLVQFVHPQFPTPPM